MTKKPTSLSLDSEILAELKHRNDINRSAVANDFFREYLFGEEENPGEIGIEERKRHLQEQLSDERRKREEEERRIEHAKENIDRIDDRIETLRERKEELENREQEREQEHEQTVKKAVDTLTPSPNTNLRSRPASLIVDLSPNDQPVQFWSDETGLEPEELIQRVEANVEKQRQRTTATSDD
jgi:seryl-tRNA synthetase